MKTEILKLEKIEATTNSMEAIVLTLNYIPSVKEQAELFGENDSIILEF